MSFGPFAVFSPDAMLDEAIDWAKHKVAQAVSYLPGGMVAVAAVAVAKNEVDKAYEQTPLDPLGALDRGITSAWDKVDESAHEAGGIPDAVATGLEKVGEKGAGALRVLDWLTNPWVLGGVAVVVGLAVLAPYVTPFIPSKRS